MKPFESTSSSHALYFELQEALCYPLFDQDNSLFFNKTNQLMKEIADIQIECARPDWDENGASPISSITVSFANWLIENLPVVVEKPIVFPLQSGKIGMQWLSSEKTAVMLSIDEIGQLTYSAVLKNGRKKSEVQSFQGTLPSDISGAILQVGSKSISTPGGRRLA